MKKFWIEFGVYFGFALIIWFIAFFIMQPYAQETAKDTMRFCSDSFIIPGVTLSCIFVLTWIASKGIFDGLTYSLRAVGYAVVPFLMKKETKSYYNYKLAKQEKRKPARLASLLVGGIFVAFAIIFYIIYLVI